MLLTTSSASSSKIKTGFPALYIISYVRESTLDYVQNLRFQAASPRLTQALSLQTESFTVATFYSGEEAAVAREIRGTACRANFGEKAQAAYEREDRPYTATC